MAVVPDPIFAHPRLADLYDVADDDRSDLDVYARIVAELGASSVLDVGCGTGTLACLLAERGVTVFGLDPASASLDVARSKPGASLVTWIEGAASATPALGVDLILMTGNVAQVFVTDENWRETLTAVRQAVRPDGCLVFESRDPDQRAWERWTKELTYRAFVDSSHGVVTTWTELLEVNEPLVSFRHVFQFESDGTTLTSDSTLRFRERSEIEADLKAAGFRVHEVRDAPNRPGLEFVFLAQRVV